MNYTEALRRNAYWFVDYLNGRKVRSQYEDIKFILDGHDYQEIEKRRASYVDNILRHATENTLFYSKYRNFSSIEDFPVINKTIIKESNDSFIAFRYNKENLHKVTTSGSTGAPLTVWQDDIKRNRHKAENIYFSELAGYPLGSRLYYLRVWNVINKKSLVKRTKQNIIMQDAVDLSDSAFDYLIERLKNDNSTKSMLAFASTYEALSHYLSNRQLPSQVKVNSLIAISETLPEGAKVILERAFDCPVVSRYSNMENGFLAQQCPGDHGEYHINCASFYIELFHPDKDEPVASGQLGRVVVTDLFNYAMPIIRYDTGDMAIFSKNSACGKLGPVFERVEGRKVDFIYDTRGRLFSPHTVTNTMWKYSADVTQFQFIQNGQKDYLIKLNCPQAGFTRQNELLNDLMSYLGKDANIEIELVDEIPLLSSGKRKKIVNNFIKS